ncbi:hypothetical protein IWW55_000904, partial [Coemansia sp. RSA 2706]
AASAEVVVNSFRLERITSYTDLNGVLELYEDLTSNIQQDGPLYAPLDSGLPDGSAVYAATHGVFNSTNPEDTLFLGGQFFDSDQNYYSIAQYRGGEIKPLSNSGLWGDVRSMAYIDTSLYVGGSFNGTADFSLALSNVGEFNTTDQTWYPLVGGASGVVNSVVPYSPFGERAVAFTGDFRSVFAGDADAPVEIAVDGLAMWDALAGGWTNTPFLQGTPSLVYSDVWTDGRDSLAFAAGQFSAAAALEANGAVLLTPKQNIQAIDMMGFDLQPTEAGQFVVNSGMWYAKSNGSTPVLVVGGQFRTLDGGANVARLEDGKWRKLGDGVNGEVLTINNAANLLFVGGVANVSADASDNEFAGLTVLDMDKERVYETQRLQGPDGTSADVRVNKVAIRADTSMVVVGGNFTAAGGMLSCPYICTLDINEGQWSPMATSSLIDQVTDLLFVGERLIVGGTFKNGTQPTRYLRQYDFGTNAWSDIDGADKLPGPVTVLTVASDGEETTDGYYIVGVSMDDASPYFLKYDGSTVISPQFTIGAHSTINGVLEVPRSRIPSSVLGSSSSSSGSLTRRADAPVIPTGYVLAISGDLYLPNGQRASSAFFYDNQWAPFMSTVQNDGSSGFISSVFFEIPPTNVYQRHRLSVALVVIIAIAIALGITFLIVLVGLVYIYLRNRREAAATASAASAALAATTAGGTTKTPLNATMLGAGAAAGAAGAAAGARNLQSNGYHNAARDTWGTDAVAGEPVSFDNIAPNTGRLNSGSPMGLAGLAATGRKAAVSSDTYVQHDAGKKGDIKYDDANESLDSIFESAAAEAEAEAENEARERAASTGSLGSELAAAGGAAAYAMPAPRHYDGQDATGRSVSPDQSRTSMYRSDSTNPFEQRMAMRESQGAFPPAGPFSGGGDDGLGHVPMPSPRHMHSEQATAAALAGATGAGLAMAKDVRRRSESASTRNTDADYSSSSRPSGESSVGGSSAHLPIRDSLKQHPVFYAKFTFSSRETGELGFRAGERVFVIDQSDEIWWMGVVDHGPDQPLEQGVFPATYVSSEPPKSTDWAELM